MSAIFQFLAGVWYNIVEFLRPFIRIIVIVLAIGLPLFIYLVFFAKEPVLDPEVDVELGRMTAQSIEADTTGEYPVLDPEDYPEAYQYMRSMVSDLISGPDIMYRDLFKYDSIKIINRDDVLNAFCTPGGYIYVYTGLIKYLDTEDHLAGVLGHEIAHAELRHSAMGLQREFGAKRIYEFILLATPIGLADAINLKILGELTGLKYTRGQEADADKYSVSYLSHTDYACDGTAGFFIKMLEEGDDVKIPEFLSDHPASQARVRAVQAESKAIGCDTSLSDQSGWERFKSYLPQELETSADE